MTTAQQHLEKIALDRDAAQKGEQDARTELETARAELAAFQSAAQNAAAGHAEFQAWAKAEIEKARAACPPPESGFSMNFQIQNGLIVGGQITIREPRLQDWPNAADEYKKICERFALKQASAPKPAPSAPVKDNKAVAVLKQAGAAPEVIAAAKAATAGQKSVLEIHAVHMTVEPKPGGKVNVNFFGNDRKQPHNQFADIYVTRTAVQLSSDMPFLDPEIFESAEEYAVDLTIGYTLSDKLNSKSNPYKDVLFIRELQSA